MFKIFNRSQPDATPEEQASTDSPDEITPVAPAENSPQEVDVVGSEALLLDFENEFASPEEPSQDDPLSELKVSEPHPMHDELEEWSEPLESTPLAPMEVGTELQSGQGTFKIEEFLLSRGAENVYRASSTSEGKPEEILWLREAEGAAGEKLAREATWRAEWESGGRILMLPRLVASFESDGRTYLATEMPPSEATLAQFLQGTENSETPSDPAEYLSEVLLILVQLAAFLIKLHGAGYAHLGLRPEIVVPGKPVRILDCLFAAPLGSHLEASLSLPGYSAPELMHPGAVDARSDLYAIGAMLYRAVTGTSVPETGTDFTTWQPRLVMAGVPQLLRRCLGEVETRFNGAEELHRALVKLKNRLRPTISYAMAGASTIGLEPSRSTNQDAFGMLSGAWESESGPTTWAAFCVADGMGGMAAGEVASELAVDAFLRGAADWCSGAAKQGAAPPTAAQQTALVKEWASAANGDVVAAMEARHARGGCTLDAGFVLDRRLCIAHVGDARLYLLRNDSYELLSRDHSFVMSLLLQNEISFDDIRTHSDRNKVTRSLGERHPQPDYFVDTLQVTQGVPTLELQPGDVLLACSDGLWEPVLETEMIAEVQSGDLNLAARELLRLALRRGAPDNATVVLLRLDEQSAPVFA